MTVKIVKLFIFYVVYITLSNYVLKKYHLIDLDKVNKIKINCTDYVFHIYLKQSTKIIPDCIITENCDSGDEVVPPPLPEKHSTENNSKLSFDPPPLPSRQSVTPTRTPRRSRVGFFDRWMPRLSVSHQTSPFLQSSDRTGSDSDLTSPK